MSSELLRRIDDYMDAVPRSAARVEDVGTLRLFVKDAARGWPYYARPIPAAGPVTAHDVERVRARQRELGVPEAFEWLVETSPGCAAAARATDLLVSTHPLMTLDRGDFRPVGPPAGLVVRLAEPGDDLASLAAVAMAGFDVPGTAIVERPSAEVDTALARISDETRAFLRVRLDEGLSLTASAAFEGRTVAVGTHQPVGTISEIVGVTTLSPFRRRGIGAAVTSLLCADAFGRGIDTVVLSAGDDDVARVYERLGFRRVGTAGAAEPPG